MLLHSPDKASTASGFVQLPNGITDENDYRKNAQNGAQWEVQAIDTGDNQ